MKPVDLLVLMVLLDGHRHGYGLVREIAERTGGQVKLVPGNFYSILKRLLDSGLLEDEGERPAEEPGRPDRRYYGITSLGRAVAAAEARRLQLLIREAESRHLIERSES